MFVKATRLLVPACFAAFAVAATWAAGAADEPKAAEAAPRTIEVWTWLNPSNPDPRALAFKQVLSNFEKAYPKIVTKVNSINWQQLDEAIIRATAAGGGPDVLNVNTKQFLMHLNAKTMQPADKYFAKWYEANGSDYTWSKSLMEADGHVWALGWDTRLTVSWYRADMIQAVGAAVPRDLIEVGTAAGKIRAANPNVEGYLWPLSTKGDAAGVVEQLIPFIRSEGGNLIDAQGKAVFNSPAGVKVMSYARDLVAKYKGMSIAAVSMSPDDLLSGVKAGTVAMTSEQSARVSGARSAAGVGDNLKTSLVPSFTPSKPSPANIAGQICAIGANSKNPDQAWEFVQFMSAPDSQLLLARAGILAVRKQVFSDPMYQTPAGKEIGLWRDYIATESSMFFPPADFSKLSEILANAAQKVVSDTGIDVKAVLDAAAKEYDQYHAQFSK